MNTKLDLDGLNVSETVSQTAETLLDEDLNAVRQGYSDDEFKAGLVYVAVVLDNDEISEKNVAEYYNVSRADLTRAYNEIVDNL